MTIETHPDIRELRATNARLAASVRMLLGRQPPKYGTPAWHALPAGHPDRERAVWRAAEAWRRYWTPEAIAARARAELDLADRIWLERFKAMTADVSRAWGAARYCAGPSMAELRRRRTLTSRLPCHVCAVPVELVHPLPEEFARRLPDTSWVCCAAHSHLLITAEEAA